VHCRLSLVVPLVHLHIGCRHACSSRGC
jgi:hypothetical protein